MTTMTTGDQPASTRASTRTGVLLREIATREIPDATDVWPAVRSRLGPRLSRRPALVGALAGGAAVAAALVWPALQRGETASASALLEQARLASEAAGGTPYHLRATRRRPEKGSPTVSDEIWYAAPGRWRIDSVVVEAGAERSRSTIIVTGREAWLVTGDSRDSGGAKAGQTRVVHTTGVAWAIPREVSSLSADQGGSTIAELLARYGAKSCGTARLRGEATLVGRSAHVVEVTAGTNGCAPPPHKAAAAVDEKADEKAASKPGATPPTKTVQDSEVTQLTVWVDKETFLPLKLEGRSRTGALHDSYEVTSLAIGGAIPDTTFRFTPPPDSAVHRFSGGTTQDVKAALDRLRTP